MTNYALVEASIVSNVIVWDGDPQSWAPPAGVVAVEIPDGVTVNIGYSFDGHVFTPPPEPPAPPAPVPTQVTMRQARLALLAAGKLAAVNEAMESLPSPQKEAAQIEWEYAATVDRDSPLIAMVGAALELDEVALDELFAAAAVL